MSDLVQFYIGHTIFWLIYFTVGLSMPTYYIIVRPKSSGNIMNILAWNYIITLVFMPMWMLLPSYKVVWYIKYILAFMIMEIWFYYGHRMMHHRKLYKWHNMHHEHIRPIGISGLYCSKVEMIMVNMASIMIPGRILGFNEWEIYVFAGLISLSVLKGHGGLQLCGICPWLSSETHDLHHLHMNVNYGVTYILDYIHGTYR